MSRAKYHQIASEIVQRIDAGEYLAGSKLPAHRVLAKELSTTAVTVAKAYQLLVEQGRLESFVGRGSFVRDNRLQRAIAADNQSLNFSILQPCVELAAAQVQQAFNQVVRDAVVEHFGYAEQSGSFAHRRAGERWSEFYGLDNTQRDMLLTTGAQQALSALITCYTVPGDLIAVEENTYPGLLAAIRYLNREAVGIALDDQGVQIDALEQCCQTHAPKMLIVVPSHQNPTGATMGARRREAVAAVVDKYKLWLVEDDIYAFLNPQPIAAIANYTPQRSFHISSLSKAISPAMRCGFMSVPSSQLQKIADFMRAMHWMPATMPFAAASVLIESAQAFSLAQQQQALARRRQCELRASLAEARLLSQPTSYSAWLKLPAQWCASEFTRAAAAQGVIVSDGAFFSTTGQGDRWVRLSVMGVSCDQRFTRAVEVISQLLTSPVEQAWHC